MKIKVVVNGKSVEIELDDKHLSIAFKYTNNPEQLLELISKIIKELKA
jgi:hypothetical protein